MSSLELESTEERAGLVSGRLADGAKDGAVVSTGGAVAQVSQSDKMIPEMIEEALERAGLM